MKLAPVSQWDYEYAFRQSEVVHAGLKYHNRAVALQALELWATAQNPTAKVAAPEVQLPDNAAAELVAEEYAAASWRWLRTRDGKETR